MTLCDRVREVCPDFRSASSSVHWSMPDPSAGGDATDADAGAAFERTADELEVRIDRLIARLSTSEGDPHAQR